MFRRPIVLSSACGLSIVALFTVRCTYNNEDYLLASDVVEGAHLVESVHAAERECYAQLGHYAPLTAGPAASCGNFDAIVSRAREAGFAVEIEARETTYAVRIIPTGRRRIVSLYSDQTEVVRMGTRNSPADRTSPPLKRKVSAP